MSFYDIERLGINAKTKAKNNRLPCIRDMYNNCEMKS